MNLSRRAICATIAAAFVPVKLPPVETAIAAMPEQVAQVAGVFGYTLDGEMWTTGYPSMEAAEAAAREVMRASFWPGDPAPEPAMATVGRVVFRGLYYPGPTALTEAVADALHDGRDVGMAVVQDFIGSNKENDFEGNFSWEAERYRESLTPAVIRHVREALARAGLSYVWDGGDLPEPLRDEDRKRILSALEHDAILGADLDIALREWAERHDLASDLRMLDTFDEVNISEAPPASVAAPVAEAPAPPAG